MPFIMKDGIWIGVDAETEPLFASLAAAARRARSLGEEIGKNIGQGMRIGMETFGGLSKSAAGGLTGYSANPIQKVIERATTSTRGTQGRNMAADMGLGNNFVFAIQDATSAVGQFGFTTTGLRFAILGATNNIQVLVMQAALAGVTFRTLTSFITPLHVALALFSAGLSLLPLLFSKASAATAEFGKHLSETNATLMAFDVLSALEGAGGSGGRLKVFENGIREIEQSIARLKNRADEIKSSGVLLFEDVDVPTFITAQTELGQITADLTAKERLLKQLTEERANAEAKVTAEKLRQQEADDRAAAHQRAIEAGFEAESEMVQRLMEEALRKGFDPNDFGGDKFGLREGDAFRIAEEKDRLRRIEESMRQETGMLSDEAEREYDNLVEKREREREQKAREASERFRKSRDFPLQMQRLDMELAELKKGQFTTKFESPESIVKSIQAEADSGVERNQREQIRLQELQNQKADLIIDTIKNTGGLPGLAFILP